MVPFLWSCLNMNQLLKILNLYKTTPQNGQTHLNKSSAFADELVECV